MKRLLVLVSATALALPSIASAKGWITVSSPPGGVEAGEAWEATVRFDVHAGASFVSGRPELVFTHADRGTQRRFASIRLGQRTFRARVTLPLPGTWTVYIYAYTLGAVGPDPRSRTLVVRRGERERDLGRSLWAATLSLVACGAIAVLRLTSRYRRRSASSNMSPPWLQR